MASTRQRVWSRTSFGPTSIAAGATFSTDLLANAETATGRQLGALTVVRMIGRVGFRMTAVSVAMDSLDVGIVPGIEGLGSFPSVDDPAQSADWMWVDKLVVLNVTIDGWLGYKEVTFDVRSMRKLRQYDRALAYLIKNTDGSLAVEHWAHIRVLLLI